MSRYIATATASWPCVVLWLEVVGGKLYKLYCEEFSTHTWLASYFYRYQAIYCDLMPGADIMLAEK